ncbi:tyrosine-type recombinase/integrase [Nocardia vinacea]|uniref:tyrosine-type recombinase/integrase n=1 Tax=Nocardia vinacea TaxID=96468 RepID=UPI0033F442EB
MTLDYPWLVVHPFPDLANRSGVALGFGPRWLDIPAKEAGRIGYAPNVGRRSLQWACVRIALANNDSRWEMIDATRIEQLREQIITVGQRPDLQQLRPPTTDADSVHWRRSTRTYPHVAHVVLHGLGVIDQAPRIISHRLTQQHELPKATAEMDQIIDRYLDRTVPNRDRVRGNVRGRLHTFTAWLARHHPDVTSFAHLTREHLEQFMTWVNTDYCHYRTGVPVSIETRRSTISVLNVFLRKTLAWEWDGIPNRPLLSHLDLPKNVERVPRYLPADQLAAIEEQIRALADPYQRAANLIARWVGPRRSEIRRLELDCLDTYPDGHPRLRIPAGKTYTERIVPLHPEAAAALHECINATRHRKQRPLIDEVTSKPTHYIFQIRGRLMSDHRLFDSALRTACDNTGLVDHTGAKLVTSHRFRHTVGTQLAEQGARLQTIMSILGHSSSPMSLIYARIADTTVLQDYKDALQPGAQIAGPAAAALRNNKLPQTTIDWLHSNYYKTALELGHCLRLPEEGPCECDLFLTCSKLLTTTEYAPRLKDRLCLEHTLAEDAASRRWPREAERHNAIATRLETLLTELESGADSSELEHLPARDNGCDE